MNLRVSICLAGLGLGLFAGGVGVGATISAEDAVVRAGRVEGRLTPQPYTLPLAYAEWVIRECDATGVPVWLACRLFAYESGWKPTATHFNDNGTVDRGIAQINSANYSEFSMVYNAGVRLDPFDPETAIRVGVRYLADLHARYGSWRMAVRKYAGNRSEAGTAWIMGEGRTK